MSSLFFHHLEWEFETPTIVEVPELSGKKIWVLRGKPDKNGKFLYCYNGEPTEQARLDLLDYYREATKEDE